MDNILLYSITLRFNLEVSTFAYAKFLFKKKINSHSHSETFDWRDRRPHFTLSEHEPSSEKWSGMKLCIFFQHSGDVFLHKAQKSLQRWKACFPVDRQRTPKCRVSDAQKSVQKTTGTL